MYSVVNHCSRRMKYRILKGYSITRLRLVLFCSFIMAKVIFIMVLAPVVFYLSPTLQDYLIFRASPDFSPELASPEMLGLYNTRSFYITTEEGIKLGTWHILPDAAPTPSTPETLVSRTERFESELRKPGSVVVIVYHGNTPSRAQGHRVKLCKLLAKLGCHVLAFDYRSYADSSPAPLTEAGLVADGVAVYEHVEARVGVGTAVLLWGHSLGSGVAAAVSAHLCSRGPLHGSGGCASGLVLHSGFTDLSRAVRDSTMAMPMRWVPWFAPLVSHALSSRDLVLNTTGHVEAVSGPVLIIHAADDTVLPVHHGRRLHTAAKSRNGAMASVGGAGPAGGVTYVEFSSDLGYGHNGIVDAPSLPVVVGEFIQLCLEYHREQQEGERGLPVVRGQRRHHW